MQKPEPDKPPEIILQVFVFDDLADPIETLFGRSASQGLTLANRLGDLWRRSPGLTGPIIRASRLTRLPQPYDPLRDPFAGISRAWSSNYALMSADHPGYCSDNHCPGFN